MNFKNDTEAIEAFISKYKQLNNEIAKVIVGQDETIKNVLISVFSKGHCLLVGVPGLAKTLLVNTIADALGMSFLVIYLIFSSERRDYQLFAHFKFELASMKELLKVGSPLMFQGFFALATWTLFFTWLEQKGQFDLTVSQNIRAIYFLAFVPIWGFAGTTKTYISQYIGAKKFDEIPTIQKRIQFMTLMFLCVTFLVHYISGLQGLLDISVSK